MLKLPSVSHRQADTIQTGAAAGTRAAPLQRAAAGPMAAQVAGGTSAKAGRPA